MKTQISAIFALALVGFVPAAAADHTYECDDTGLVCEYSYTDSYSSCYDNGCFSHEYNETGTSVAFVTLGSFTHTDSGNHTYESACFSNMYTGERAEEGQFVWASTPAGNTFLAAGSSESTSTSEWADPCWGATGSDERQVGGHFVSGSTSMGLAGASYGASAGRDSGSYESGMPWGSYSGTWCDDFVDFHAGASGPSEAGSVGLYGDRRAGC